MCAVIHKCTGSHSQINARQSCVCDNTFVIFFNLQILLYLFVNFIHLCESQSIYLEKWNKNSLPPICSPCLCGRGSDFFFGPIWQLHSLFVLAELCLFQCFASLSWNRPRRRRGSGPSVHSSNHDKEPRAISTLAPSPNQRKKTFSTDGSPALSLVLV